MSAKTAKITTLALAAGCGVLSVIALLQYGGWGRGYHWLSNESERILGEETGQIHKELFKLPEATSFAETRMRPIFNEDRKPTPIATEEPVAEEPPPPSVPLNVSLTGVILTPEVCLVMLRDNMKNQALSLKEGMPMPGETGSWILTAIKPRSAVFKNSSGEETVEVELMSLAHGPKSPASSGMGNPPPSIPVPVGYPAPMPPPSSINPEMVQPEQQAAADLQRRIEERRRQIRDEAERLKQQQDPQDPTQQ